MPLYDIRCLRSNCVFERFIPLANFSDPIICACGSSANRVISTPMFSVDQTGYNCPITGDWIGSKRQHEENLKVHNCRVLETGEKEANDRKRAEADASLERALDTTIEREIETLPSDKKERLFKELENGLDLAVERR